MNKREARKIVKSELKGNQDLAVRYEFIRELFSKFEGKKVTRRFFTDLLMEDYRYNESPYSFCDQFEMRVRNPKQDGKEDYFNVTLIKREEFSLEQFDKDNQCYSVVLNDNILSLKAVLQSPTALDGYIKLARLRGYITEAIKSIENGSNSGLKNPASNKLIKAAGLQVSTYTQLRYIK